ncbi:hypothetical protein TKK_0008281 [Trichogramma kaykai]|uniref:Protein-cysteine N-palmitoyltransferase Rasp n=1 Tax=Trichogramma kaykai TaxID=54128 RepID=A0ABD2X4J3_9HYME
MAVDQFPKAEVRFYFAAWIAAVAYSVYCVHLVTESFFKYYDDAYNDFAPGWKLLQRKLDTSDEEWKVWIPLIFKLVPWVVVQIVVSQLIKKYHPNKKLICGWYMAVSLTYLWTNFGLLSTLCTLLLPCLSCLLASVRSKSLSWCAHCCTLGLIYWAKISDVVFREWLGLDDEAYFLLTAAICWIQLRSISYGLDSIDGFVYEDVDGFVLDLMKNVAYCLYLPTLFLGPIILYEQFVRGIEKAYHPWSLDRTKKIALDLARYFFWLYVTQFCLHYVYFNALRFHPDAVRRLGPWALYGFGYCLGQYFLNKYVVVYGLASTACRADDVQAPAQPKCIGRIHLYSDMWKHFDRGLYTFLLKYIYIPCNARSNLGKVLATAVSFTFIYLWHGMHLYIFIWSFLNFLGLVIENTARSFSDYFYKVILRDKMGPSNKRRFECALCSPLLAFSAISNFYFFAGDEIGHTYVWRFFTESWSINLLLLSILYCCCQTSTEIKLKERVCSIKTKDQYEE